MEGAKAVIVINTFDEEEIVPSAEGEEKEWGTMVPLVLVSNSTGIALEKLLVAVEKEGGGKGEGKGLRVGVREAKEDGETEPLVLGGYHVLNVKLQRG